VGAAWLAFHGPRTQALIPPPLRAIGTVGLGCAPARPTRSQRRASRAGRDRGGAQPPCHPTRRSRGTTRPTGSWRCKSISRSPPSPASCSPPGATETQAAEDDSHQKRGALALCARGRAQWATGKWNLATDQVFWSDAIRAHLRAKKKGRFSRALSSPTPRSCTRTTEPESWLRFRPRRAARYRTSRSSTGCSGPTGRWHWLEGQGAPAPRRRGGGSPRMIGTVADVSETQSAPRPRSPQAKPC